MNARETARRFKMGARVDATDGRCGHVARVIIDPVAESLTHLAVEPGHHEERTRLVPIDLVETIEDDLVRLRCTKQEFDQLDSAEDVQFLSADTGGFGYTTDIHLWPYYPIGAPLPHPGSSGHSPMFSDRIPLNEVEINRGDPVHATDGLIGKVEGLVIDPADHDVTHVLLQEGHIWGRKQVAIPIGTAARVGDLIEVSLTKDEIEALPAVTLGSYPSGH